VLGKDNDYPSPEDVAMRWLCWTKNYFLEK
jgi:hypothetical protein